MMYNCIWIGKRGNNLLVVYNEVNVIRIQYPLYQIPGGLVVRIWRSHRHGPGSIPGLGRYFCQFISYSYPLLSRYFQLLNTDIKWANTGNAELYITLWKHKVLGYWKALHQKPYYNVSSSLYWPNYQMQNLCCKWFGSEADIWKHEN